MAVRAALLCAAFFLHHASAELRGRCPAEEAACPARAQPCSSDDDCGEQICCNTSCGQACIDPLYTGCENIRMSSERISRALAAEGARSGRGRARAGSVRAPRCRASDGEFEPVQCDNEIVSSCWCVDAAGFEIAGTRAPAASLVNCTAAATCAAHTCRMLCPLGFELDARGCPLCRCRDPCAAVACPSALTCQLEETPCLRQPCPPVPTCKRGRSLQNICPAGEPLLISETNRPFLCGTDPGKPNCPPLYRCLVESGNDYGVCCPASLELQKAGTCPAPEETGEECGAPCAHDLECAGARKCCAGACGRACALPRNVTACAQQRLLAELLVVSEREGKGYVPQCTADGEFEPKQCSRNGLVCWCVDNEGTKLRGSMGAAEGVRCAAARAQRSGARSLASCAHALCASVCEYGYKSGSDGCPTCECDDPCAGFPCAADEECVRVRDADCSGELCTGYPVCRPKVSYENPCSAGAPATDADGSVVGCGAHGDCPAAHACVRARRSGAAVCCPDADNATDSSDINDVADDIAELNLEACSVEAEALCSVNSTARCADGACPAGRACCAALCGPLCVDPDKMRLQTDRVDDVPTMCEYLRDFDEKMEGTVDGMRLALAAPACAADGAFLPRQCAGTRCWCVDSFGTEIPGTATHNASALDCDKVRSELQCLDMTCRMGCDYGFELGADGCPSCRCRDPCAGVACPAGRACSVVDVACDADYCPPVPACLPRKAGQCPYLVPDNGACEWACRGDGDCAAALRCCATGCGTACTEPVHHSPCQQRRALALHTAAESGSPPSWSWIPECREDGGYVDIQCRASDKTCWCVDTDGNEIPGTRATNSTPTCDAPAPCPALDCGDVTCAHGHALDARGCASCACADPCARAACRPGETCELIPIDCEGETCPPLARCAPAPQCPDGEPLQAPDGSGALACGPSAAACPSTHACRFAPHDSRPPVCCPKPRTVCFESKEAGRCEDGSRSLNASRWWFNHERNRCERFAYHGCAGNHNNFRSKEECNAVCPVLSPCERLREKNEAAAQKYGKGTFVPACDAAGAWEPVQCMSHIEVCWCVSARGEPLKGSLVRGARPTCNFRQARKWARRDPLDERAQADQVLEELIRQMTAYRVEEFTEEDEEDIDGADQESEVREESGEDKMAADEAPAPAEVVAAKDVDTARAPDKPLVVKLEDKVAQIAYKTKCQMMQEESDNGDDIPRPRCLADGSFAARQCARGRCWCVDAAGQRRPHAGPVPDLPADDPCERTQIESAVLELELVGASAEAGAAARARDALQAALAARGAGVRVTLLRAGPAATLRAALPGPRAADLVYHIEQMVKQEKLQPRSGEGLGADVIRSEYRLAAPAAAPPHREILTESTVSAATSYHTALIVLAATSAFIISVLCVLVMLYRARLAREPHKAERFLPAAPPVYVLSADEKAELARVLRAPAPAQEPPRV